MGTLKGIVILGLMSFLTSLSYGQMTYPYFKCPDPTPHVNANDSLDFSPYSGLFKPSRSDEDGNGSLPNGFFPVLVVFVRFPNDPSIIGWPANDEPDYLGNLIATSKATVVNGEWWNAYSQSTQLLSDQYKEMSRGHLDLVSPFPNPNGSGAYSVVLPMTPAEYWEESSGNYSEAERLINEDIWEEIQSQGLTDWRPYDRWKKLVINFILDH